MILILSEISTVMYMELWYCSININPDIVQTYCSFSLMSITFCLRPKVFILCVEANFMKNTSEICHYLFCCFSGSPKVCEDCFSHYLFFILGHRTPWTDSLQSDCIHMAQEWNCPSWHSLAQMCYSNCGTHSTVPCGCGLLPACVLGLILGSPEFVSGC